MSTVPAEIAGLGSTSQKMRVVPGFDPVAAAVGPEEYFLLSRVDGKQTVRDILLGTGLPIDRAVAIVIRLRSIGAVLIGDETAGGTLPSVPRTITNAPPTARTQTQPRAATQQGTAAPGQTPPRPTTPGSSGAFPRVATNPGFPRPPSNQGNQPSQPRASTPPWPPAVSIPPAQTTQPSPARTTTPISVTRTATGPRIELDLRLPNATAEEMAALNETIDMPESDKRRVIAMMRLVVAGDPWMLLGVPHNSDARDLKRAYFRLSKDIHPDRYYGKKLGSFATRLPAVFEAVSRAYAKLTSPEKPRAQAAETARTEQPQTPQEYGIELFERACALEVSGDALGAMKLFAAAVRIDPQIRYLRRAASCALAASQPKSALEYAKKAQSLAPDDPSSARLLASAFRAAGKLVDAEEVLIMAMALKSENDSLGSELRHDLAEVRRLLAQETR